MKGTARRWIEGLLWLVAVALILATLIPILDSNAWWIRNLTFPQAQVTAALLIVLVLTLGVLGRRGIGVRLLIVGLVAAIGYQLFYLLPYTPLAGRTVAEASSCPTGDRVRLIEANVKAGNYRHEPILALVERERPDLFFAVETDDAWRRALAPLRRLYPHVIIAPRNDYWSMMLFSRFLLGDPQVLHLVDDYVPSIRASVALPSGRHFVFHGLHPRPPMEHGSAKGDADLVRAGLEIARERQPALLTGDLNDVPWSSTTQLFGRVSGMGDVRVGRGFIASFDANSHVMRWPLDHMFVTPGIRVAAFRRLGDIGSDHFPMFADLCLTGEDRAPDARDATWRRARQVISTGNDAPAP